jgi:O-antigen/teichoic acid export membrane protein
MTTARRILSNIGALSVARGITAILALVTMVHMARVLEPAAYGMLMWALAYVAYFHLIPDLGLGIWGTREVARTPSRATELVSKILGLRLVVAVVVLAIYLGSIALLDLPPLFKLVIAIQGGALMANAVAVDYLYQGIERMGVLAVRNVIVGALTLVGVLLFVRSPADVGLASAAVVAPALAANVWLLLTYRREFGPLRLFRHAEGWKWQPVLSQSIPIAASLVLVAINLNLDQLLLGVLRSSEEVGLYGAAYRILLATTIPAQILVLAFFPALSSALGDPTRMRERARVFARILLAVGLPIAGAGILLAPQIMGVFGMDYERATLALRILMIHCLIYYLHQVYGHSLIAWNQQRQHLRALAAGAIVNVALNFALIPRFGIEGAAVATLSAEATVITWLVVVHRRLGYSLYGIELLRAIAVAASSVGAAAVAHLYFALHIVPTLLLMLVIFVVGAVVFRVASPGDLRAILHRPNGVVT